MILRRRGWILPEPELMRVRDEIFLDSRQEPLLLAGPEFGVGEVSVQLEKDLAHPARREQELRERQDKGPALTCPKRARSLGKV